MTSGIVHRIESVAPAPGYCLLVTWTTGRQTIVDFSRDTARGGAWLELRDAQKFARARIANDGAVLEWPEPAGADGSPRIDIDADGLYEMAARQSERATFAA
jgi:hypothetical protein